MTEERDILKNLEKTRNLPQQLDWYRQRHAFLEGCGRSGLETVDDFPVFSSRQMITKFIERYEIYKRVVEVPGAIFECGVASGFGMMAFAHFCSIFEPYAYTRKIVGFDTFEGFPEPHEKDKTSRAAHMKKGGLAYDSFDILKSAIGLYDQNRALGHIPKVDLVKGDISKTLPEYLAQNPHTVIALLYLDLDLYEATRDTINLLNPRLAKGSIVVFDELNHADYPGETAAVMETFGLGRLRLQRLPFAATACFAVID